MYWIAESLSYTFQCMKIALQIINPLSAHWVQETRSNFEFFFCDFHWFFL